MSREEKKLTKHVAQRANSELRKTAQKKKSEQNAAPKSGRAKLDPRFASEEYEDGAADKRPHRSKTPQQQDRETFTAEGLLVETGPSTCIVLAGGELIRCHCELPAAAGDLVKFSPERRRIVALLPRRSVLSRPDPHNPRFERLIAANIDIVVNVASVNSPPLRPGLIDRYLIAIENSGADPLLCVNKADLIVPAEMKALEECLGPYRELGIAVLLCSAATGQGIKELAGHLAAKTCVLAGHSGVGKSSLLNALAPSSGAATGAVSAVHETGRHTTTASKLYNLPGGGLIIDTPGIREFGLWNVTAGQVRGYFHEFDDIARNCGFSDCTHTHEPNCAVMPAVEAGEISRVRYESYRRIMESILHELNA